MVAVDIATFLAARLDEDEAVAKACGVGIRDTWHTIEWYDGQFEDGLTVSVDVHGLAGTPITSRGVLLRADGVHIARHDPARVLAEVAAKRAIVAEYEARDKDADLMLGPDVLRQREWSGLRLAVHLLATAYASHPDYDQSWRPDAPH